MKPSLDYNIEERLPNNVKMLFLAEAPPFHPKNKSQTTDSYFFNPLETLRFFGPPEPLLGTLSWNIFNLLKISSKLTKEIRLQQFKKLGCYFIEAIKCRVDRTNKNIVNKTIKNCSYYLQKELEEIKYTNLVIMGERALLGIRNCAMFSEIIPDMSLLQLVKQMRSRPLQLANRKLFFLPLPLWHNRIHLEIIQATFANICKELGID
jgi:hypothetical protein